jgi:hypothetical protein
MPETLPYDCCSECGGSLEDGYEIRNLEKDPETGDTDEWVLCSSCVQKENDDRDIERDSFLNARYNAGDMAYDLGVEA